MCQEVFDFDNKKNSKEQRGLQQLYVCGINVHNVMHKE